MKAATFVKPFDVLASALCCINASATHIYRGSPFRKQIVWVGYTEKVLMVELLKFKTEDRE